MISKIQLKPQHLYILILILGFAWIYPSVFDSKIDTNGDNAGYYIIAKSIAQDHSYRNIHHPQAEAANHLPPGYPAMIALGFTIFGYKITVIKLLNGILFLLSLLFLFALFKKLTQSTTIAFSAVVLLEFNAHLLRFSTLIMSEIPFLFFSTASLLVFLKLHQNKSPLRDKYFYLLLGLVACSFYIRTTGIAILAGILFSLLLQKKFKTALSLSLGFFALILPWQIRSHLLGGNSYLAQLIQKNPYRPELGTMNLSDWLERFLTNLKRYSFREIPNALFPHNNIDYQLPISGMQVITGIVILAMLIYGLLIIKNHKSLLLGYLGSYFAILLLWPEVWYGVRFVLPIVPLLILCFCLALERIFTQTLKHLKIKSKTVSFFIQLTPIIFLLYWMYPQIKFTQQMAKLPYPMNYNNYLFIAKWTKTNTPKDAVICCRKDQLFYLFSDRKCIRYKNTLSPEELIEDLIHNKVDYVVLEQLGFVSTPRYLYPAIQKYPNKFVAMHHQKSPDTYLFRFEPQKGYTGQWKENKKNGIGRFGYENGEFYRGEWKNDLRNGKGVYHLLSGDSIVGIWRNDSLIQKLN